MDEDEPVNPEEEPSSSGSSPSPEGNEPEDVSDVLGQSDIDSLLAQVSGEPEETDESESGSGELTRKEKVIYYDGRLAKPDETVKVEPYDFRNPVFLGEAEMRRLRLLHEEFIHFLEARLALFLRMDFSLSMTKLTTVSYEQAISEVENPSHLVVFKSRPMPGVGCRASFA